MSQNLTKPRHADLHNVVRKKAALFLHHSSLYGMRTSKQTYENWTTHKTILETFLCNSQLFYFYFWNQQLKTSTTSIMLDTVGAEDNGGKPAFEVFPVIWHHAIDRLDVSKKNERPNRNEFVPEASCCSNTNTHVETGTIFISALWTNKNSDAQH